MSKKVNELLSKNAYASYLGVNEKAIRKAVNEGKIKKGWDAVNQKIIKHLADKEYGFQHKVPKPGPGLGAGKVIERLKSEENTAKLAKPRTKTLFNSDVKKEPLKSEDTAGEQALFSDEEINDLSNYNSYELTKILKITASMSYPDALKANMIIEAATKKKKLEELENILVRREDIEKILFAFGSQLKQALLNIPARITDDVLGAASKVEAMKVMTEEITSVLNMNGLFENINLSNKS